MNKAVNMLACWMEDPTSEAFERWGGGLRGGAHWKLGGGKRRFGWGGVLCGGGEWEGWTGRTVDW